MGNEIIEKVDKYIQAIAESLGVAAEHVYRLLVRQQIVEGSIRLSVGLFLLVLMVLTIKWSIEIYTKAKFEDDKYTPINIWAKFQKSNFVKEQIIWIIGGFLWLILAIVGLGLSTSGGLLLLNPEYYAIKEIMDVFSK